MIWGVLCIAVFLVGPAFILWVIISPVEEKIRLLEQHRENIGRDYVRRVEGKWPHDVP